MYKIKRAVVDAIQWTGDNWEEIQTFAGEEPVSTADNLLFFEDFFVVESDWLIKTSNEGNVFLCDDALFKDLFIKEG